MEGWEGNQSSTTSAQRSAFVSARDPRAICIFKRKIKEWGYLNVNEHAAGNETLYIIQEREREIDNDRNEHATATMATVKREREREI